MAHHNIIVIGASAGGVEALSKLIHRLPSDLAAALFVVVHFPTYATSVLPDILNRSGAIPASHAYDREPIQPNHIYIAPPNYHLLLSPGYVRLIQGPRENGHRPAIDPLFQSAAKTYGKQVIGVILSGSLDDGTVGLSVIKHHDGVVIVQDPSDALFDGMPKSAIAHVRVDYVLPIQALADTLVELVQDEAQVGDVMTPDDLEREADIVSRDKAALEQGQRPGEPSMLTCPDCGGVLWELREGDILRYRCHVGHAYTIDSLVAEQADAVETALWTAHRALEEQAALSRRLANEAEGQHRTHSAKRFREQASEISQKADTIRAILTNGGINVTFNEPNGPTSNTTGDND